MTVKRDPVRVNTPHYLSRSKNINFRVTPGEHERIRLAAAKKGLNITRWIESLIFKEEK
jgi:predicted DNA binding CopG/RHH family protein